MKKMVLYLIAAVCFSASFTVAQESISTEEFQKVTNDWFAFNGGGREANEAYNNMMNEIRATIEKQFPMSPELVKQVEALKAEREAELQKKAAEMGYDNWQQAVGKDGIYFGWLNNEYAKKEAQLTAEYLEDFNGFYRAACSEALKRLMNNAEKMGN